MVSVTASCTSGTISVKANNCLGSCTARILTVTGSKLPSTPGTISGCAIGLCRKTGVVYSVAAVSGATSYVWTLPAGATGASTTNSITVAFGTAFTGTGVITVKAKNACGTSTNAASLTVSALLAAPGVITGSASTPKTQTAGVYSIVAVAGATSYTWTISGGAKFVGATTGTSVKVNFTTATSATAVITVKANNACGCSAASSKTITVTSAVAARPSNNGNTVSAPETNILPDYTVYPNPSNGQFKISFNTKESDKVVISVMDINGKVVYTSAKTYSAGYQLSQVNIAKVAKGVYYAHIWRNGIEEKTVQVLIQQ
jgi:large repetitive protein